MVCSEETLRKEPNNVVSFFLGFSCGAVPSNRSAVREETFASFGTRSTTAFFSNNVEESVVPFFFSAALLEKKEASVSFLKSREKEESKEEAEEPLKEEASFFLKNGSERFFRNYITMVLLSKKHTYIYNNDITTI